MPPFAPRRSPLLGARSAPAPIVAVASGKGGVGKTWFSATLACLWGKAGARTLLIDGDLGLANADVQLGVRPQADLMAALKGWVEMEAAATPVHGGAGARGFDLLPGRSGTGALATLSLEETHQLAFGFKALARRYDRIVLDLAAGLDANTMRLARAADRIVVVTTEEPTALTDAFAFLKVLRLQGEAPPASVVVNMADKRLSARKTYDRLADACDKHLGFRPPLAGVIMRDPCVPDCIRAQTALPIRNPTAPSIEDVKRISETLAAG